MASEVAEAVDTAVEAVVAAATVVVEVAATVVVVAVAIVAVVVVAEATKASRTLFKTLSVYFINFDYRGVNAWWGLLQACGNAHFKAF